MKTEIFCAACQKDRPHELRNEKNGEVSFNCERCGHFLKVPPKLSDAALKKYLAEHKAQNDRNPVRSSSETMVVTASDVGKLKI